MKKSQSSLQKMKRMRSLILISFFLMQMLGCTSNDTKLEEEIVSRVGDTKMDASIFSKMELAQLNADEEQQIKHLFAWVRLNWSTLSSYQQNDSDFLNLRRDDIIALYMFQEISSIQLKTTQQKKLYLNGLGDKVEVDSETISLSTVQYNAKLFFDKTIDSTTNFFQTMYLPSIDSIYNTQTLSQNSSNYSLRSTYEVMCYEESYILVVPFYSFDFEFQPVSGNLYLVLRKVKGVGTNRLVYDWYYDGKKYSRY